MNRQADQVGNGLVKLAPYSWTPEDWDIEVPEEVASGEKQVREAVTAEFKRDAIALVDSSGETVTSVARELGISPESGPLTCMRPEQYVKPPVGRVVPPTRRYPGPRQSRALSALRSQAEAAASVAFPGRACCL
ncbi:transposase, partial [Streptomyces sp. NPDC058394]|uniref:transposase n=1 Tax=Streptomyces sp. NPDC058394 TaxID=3346477 RepID=UPI00365F0D21